MANPPNRDIVIFLGAGFSVHAGLPTMTQFRLKSDEARNALNGHPPRYELANFVEAGRVFESFRNFCEKADKAIKSEANNLESVFCVAESLVEAGVPSLNLDGHDCSMSYVLEQIQLWIWQIYAQLRAVDDESLEKPYLRLMEFLKPLEQTVGVLTTNYDLVFEYHARRAGLPIFYPFGDFSLKEVSRRSDDKIDSSMLIQVYKNAAYNEVMMKQAGGDGFCGIEPKPSSSGFGIPIAKLHGSINYFNMIREGQPAVMRIANDVAPKGAKIGLTTSPKEWPAVLAFDAMWSLRTKYGGRIVPAIIPPTYAKLQATPWVRHTWTKAFERIRLAKKIVFVGYSLPHSDGFMLGMLRSAIAMRESSQPLSIYVIDPCEATLDRYGKLFGPLKLVKEEHLIQKPFDASLDDLEKILSPHS